jgi:hypothetical protein
MNATTMMTDTHYKPSDARQFSDGTFPRPLREGCLSALFLKDRFSSSSEKAYSGSLATKDRVRGGGGKAANEQLEMSNEQWGGERSIDLDCGDLGGLAGTFVSLHESYVSLHESYVSLHETAADRRRGALRKGQNVRNGHGAGQTPIFRYGFKLSAIGVKAKNNFFERRDYGKII